jgi:acyl carrier protein
MGVRNGVIKVFGQVLEEFDASTLTRESDMDSVNEWDSVHFLQILLELEEEFEVKFKPGEVARLFSIGNIVDIISTKIERD